MSTRWFNASKLLCASFVLCCAFILVTLARAVDVLEDMNNPSRTGENPNETILNTSNVNQNTFGKVWSYPVNGSTYAQALYASGISIGGGTNDAVFIETMADQAYAFSATSNAQYWHVSFTGGDITPVPPGDYPSGNNIIGNLGVESTPYIDKSLNTIYMVAKTKNTSNSTYYYTLHALSLTDGSEQFGGPVNISASGFNVKQQNQRMGLAKAGNNIIVTWTSYQDSQPYHGWMMAYNETTLSQAGVFNDTSSGNQAGIWQQGRAPAVDSSGNVYVITGNGTWDGSKNFGESFLKLSSSLSLLSWFTPDNYSSLNSGDEDLGSGGALLIPGTSYVFGGGKQGTVFLLNTSNLGHEQSGNGQVHQTFSFASGEIHGGPVYYDSPVNGPVVYDMAVSDHVKEYSFNGSTFNTSHIAESSASAAGNPGGFLSVSDNNGTAGSGIVWASIETKDADSSLEPGIVRAWNADNLGGTELWDSNQNSSRDSSGTFVKDANPTVANGMVFVGSYSNRVNVYGLLSSTNTNTNTFIAENLSYTASGASTSLQTDTNFNPPTWVELEATGTNQSITYTIPNLAAGTYELQMQWKGNTNRGELSLSVDGGAPLTPDPLDQYSATETYPITTFSPNLTFSSSGSHTITLTVVGENPSSTGFYLSTFDFIFNPVITFSGTYELQNETSGLALNVKGASTSNGAEVVQYPFGGGSANAEWTFTPTSNGYYQIVNVNSSLDVAVAGASTATKALIDQWSFGTTGDDQWIPTQNSDGSFTFLNLNSGLALDDPGGSTSANTQMDQYTNQGSSNQKWEVISE